MNRNEAMKLIEAIVRDFSVDDTKDWLSEAATVLAGENRRAGNSDISREYMQVANDIAAVKNRGV